MEWFALSRRRVRPSSLELDEELELDSSIFNVYFFFSPSPFGSSGNLRRNGPLLDMVR